MVELRMGGLIATGETTCGLPSLGSQTGLPATESPPIEPITIDLRRRGVEDVYTFTPPIVVSHYMTPFWVSYFGQ